MPELLGPRARESGDQQYFLLSSLAGGPRHWGLSLVLQSEISYISFLISHVKNRNITNTTDRKKNMKCLQTYTDLNAKAISWLNNLNIVTRFEHLGTETSGPGPLTRGHLSY